MSPFFRFALPALVVGCLMGFFVGRTVALASGELASGEKDARPSAGAWSLKLSDVEAGGPADNAAGEDCRPEYAAMARLCVQEALRARGESGRAKTSALEEEDSSGSDLAVLRAQLEELLRSVEEHGSWTRGAGVKARHILRQLPAADAERVAAILEEAMDAGLVVQQPGAWVPAAH